MKPFNVCGSALPFSVDGGVPNSETLCATAGNYPRTKGNGTALSDSVMRAHVLQQANF